MNTKKKLQLIKENQGGAKEFEMPLVSFMFLKEHTNINSIREAAKTQKCTVKQFMLANKMRFDFPKEAIDDGE